MSEDLKDKQNGTDEVMQKLTDFLTAIDKQVEDELTAEKQAKVADANEAPAMNTDENQEQTFVSNKVTLSELQQYITESVCKVLETHEIEYTSANLKDIAAILADMSLQFAQRAGLEMMEERARNVAKKMMDQVQELAMRKMQKDMPQA
jgi:hypothetical protein